MKTDYNLCYYYLIRLAVQHLFKKSRIYIFFIFTFFIFTFPMFSTFLLVFKFIDVLKRINIKFYLWQTDYKKYTVELTEILFLLFDLLETHAIIDPFASEKWYK